MSKNILLVTHWPTYAINRTFQPKHSTSTEMFPVGDTSYNILYLIFDIWDANDGSRFKFAFARNVIASISIGDTSTES